MRLCYGASTRAQPSPGLSFPSVHEAVRLDHLRKLKNICQCPDLPSPEIPILLVWGMPEHQNFIKVSQEPLMYSRTETLSMDVF